MIAEFVAAAACIVPSVPAVQGGEITLSAKLLGDELRFGEEYKIEISLGLGDGWTTSDAGVPTPLLQFDVPDSVVLAGKVLESYRELSRNEFLNEPFERQFKGDHTEVDFTLVGEPGNSALGINLVAYARHEDGRVRFIRRRVDLPISPNAAAESDERATDSSWGNDMGLQIGDKAKPFDLPRADGTTVQLNDYLGQSNIIVTTYRAYW